MSSAAFFSASLVDSADCVGSPLRSACWARSEYALWRAACAASWAFRPASLAASAACCAASAGEAALLLLAGGGGATGSSLRLHPPSANAVIEARRRVLCIMSSLPLNRFAVFANLYGSGI